MQRLPSPPVSRPRAPHARLATILLAGLTTGAVAGEPLSPDEAVRLALAGHPLLEAARQERIAATADLLLASSGRLPRLEISEEIARSTHPVFVFGSKLAQERFTASDFDLAALNTPDALTHAATRFSARQSVWDAGRTGLALRAARAGEDAAEAQIAGLEDEIAFGALRAFWDRVVAERMVEVADGALAAARSNLELAGELVDAGLAVPSDRMAAEVRLAEVRTLEIRAREGLAVADAALSAALGADPARRFEPRAPSVPPPVATEPFEVLLATAHERRADLQALEARRRQADAGLRTAKSGRLPEIGAHAAYEISDDVPFGAAGSNWTVGVGARWTAFDGFETRARVARAQAESARLAALREARVQQIRLEVRSALAGVEAAAERWTTAAGAQRQAEEALRIVRDRYGEGMALSVELLAAEAALTRARAEHVVAEGGVWLAHAELERATGGG